MKKTIEINKTWSDGSCIIAYIADAKTYKRLIKSKFYRNGDIRDMAEYYNAKTGAVIAHQIRYAKELKNRVALLLK